MQIENVDNIEKTRKKGGKTQIVFRDFSQVRAVFIRPEDQDNNGVNANGS